MVTDKSVLNRIYCTYVSLDDGKILLIKSSHYFISKKENGIITAAAQQHHPGKTGAHFTWLLTTDWVYVYVYGMLNVVIESHDNGIVFISISMFFWPYNFLSLVYLFMSQVRLLLLTKSLFILFGLDGCDRITVTCHPKMMYILLMVFVYLLFMWEWTQRAKYRFKTHQFFFRLHVSCQ